MGASLLSESDAARLVDDWMAAKIEADSHLIILGIVSEQALLALSVVFQRYKWPLFLTFADSIKLLVSDNPVVYYTLLANILDAGVYVGVLKRISLLAVTLNPFYPEYRFDSKT